MSRSDAVFPFHDSTLVLTYRIRGERIVDANSGNLVYRIRGERIVDANSGYLVYRIRP